jgi:hypothetical protein
MQCESCDRDLLESNFPDGTAKCTACQCFVSTRNNQRGRGYPLQMNRAEFVEEMGCASTRRCHYCGISEESFRNLRYRAPNGFCRRLGVDRIDSEAPYEAGNIVVSCLLCNRLKSNVFSYGEFVLIGALVAEILSNRGYDCQVP